MRVSRLLVLALVAVFLASPSADAFKNGHAPRSALSPAAQGGCIKLSKPAAAAYNTMQLAARRTLPVTGCDSAYRSYSRQVYWRRWWCARGRCGNAAVPGTSNHGLGIAVDVPIGTRRTLDRVGRRYGWAKAWSDAPWEWWHIRHRAGVWKRRPNPGTNVRSPLMVERSGGPGQGWYVNRVKRHLRRHRTCTVRLNGYFSANTRRCVIRFQATHRLAGDGNVGPATWKALRRRAR